MNTKRFILFILFVAMTLLLISCQKSSPQNPYELLINSLASDDFEGRLTGTEGNAKAQHWIEDQFKTIGLEPFQGDSYAIPYDHQFYNPDKQEISLEAIYPNQERIEFKYGIDFLDQAKNFQFDETAQLAFNIDDIELSQKILVLENGQDLLKLTENKPKAILLKSERFKKIPPSIESAMPILQISNKLYETLFDEKEMIDEVNIKMKMESESIQAANVVGTVSGQDDVHKEAIIISAHFDSVGWAARTPFNGALDNATGVSMMLKLANFLNIHSSSHHIHADVIFAAFNGEESGLQGSRAFAQHLTGLYDSIYVINLDSIGGKSRGQTLINVLNGSNPLAASIVDFFNEHGLPAKLAEGLVSSDHLPFSEQNIQAITISDEDLSLLHTIDDGTDILDYDHIDKMVSALFNFLIADTHLPNNFNNETSPSEDALVSEQTDEDFSKILDEAEQYKQKLELGQYIAFIESVNQTKFVTKRIEYTYHEIADMEDRIKGLKVPNQIDGLPFESAGVTIKDFGEQIELDLEVGKIYSIEQIYSNEITSISLYYFSKAGKGLYINVYPMQPDQNEKDFISASEDKIVEDYTSNGKTYTLVYLSDIDESLYTSFVRQVNSQKFFITSYEVMKNGDHYTTISKASEKEKLVEKMDKLPWEQIIIDLGLGSQKE